MVAIVAIMLLIAHSGNLFTNNSPYSHSHGSLSDNGALPAAFGVAEVEAQKKIALQFGNKKAATYLDGTSHSPFSRVKRAVTITW